MPLQSYLLLTAALFAIGMYGLLTRRNAVGMLLSIEIMANAVNINLVAFSRYHGAVLGQVFAVFSIALTVAEVVVGLALVILLYRAQKDVAVDAASALKH
jgi:NADH-quinone oxidoreductase subunit K